MGKTDCREVIEAFEAFLNAPETHRPEIEGALNHLRTCPACRGRASYLTRLLETGAADEDDLTCHECEELLPGYLTADGLGDTDAPEWARVKRHLAACPHCAAAYASLADLVASAYGESGAEPPYYPEPNLSFLRSREISAAGPATTPEQSLFSCTWRIPACRELRGGGSATRSRSRLVAASCPRLVPAGRRHPGADRPRRRLIRRVGRAVDRPVGACPGLPSDKTPLAPAEEARDFAELLELAPPRDQHAHSRSVSDRFSKAKAALALAVNTIEPPQPIAQARVTLRDADGALLEGAFTGDDGVVLFRDLDVGEYLIRVEYAGQAWEFPLSLVLRV